MVEWIRANQSTVIFNDRYPDIIFRAPFRDRIYITNVDVGFAANQWQQFLKRNFAQVTALTGVKP